MPLLIPFFMFEAETSSQYNAQVAPAGVDTNDPSVRWRPAAYVERLEWRLCCLPTHSTDCDGARILLVAYLLARTKPIFAQQPTKTCASS
jgi:hypothetical protein